MPARCVRESCGKNAILKRPKTGDALCKECFFFCFETEIHDTIVAGNLFQRGDRVAVGASGGKDSTVLAHVMKALNARFDYGLELFLLSIDEGIQGYRDDSLETVKRNQQQYDLPLKIVSYEELYGWTMDSIVAQIGRKNNCTFCGVFRRQALDRGAILVGANKIVTGHNADDIAETVIMNVLRGDIARLRRCTSIVTGAEGALPRCKPFKYTYEKEIVMYAYFKKLDYFSTECIYSPNAYRGHARVFLKDLESIRPRAILDVLHAGETLQIKEGTKMPTQGTCERCSYISSQPLCKACVLLDGLNKGLPKLAIGSNNKTRKIYSVSSASLNASFPSSATASLNPSKSSSISSLNRTAGDDAEGSGERAKEEDGGGGGAAAANKGGCGDGGGDACGCRTKRLQNGDSVVKSNDGCGEGAAVGGVIDDVSASESLTDDGGFSGGGGGRSGGGKGEDDADDPCDEGVCDCVENDEETGEKSPTKKIPAPIPFPFQI